MTTRDTDNPSVVSLAEIENMGKSLKANSDGLLYKLEDYRNWLEVWLDSDSAGSDSQIIEQIGPLIEDANALALTIRSFRNRSELLSRSMEHAQHSETDDSSMTKPRTKERIRAVSLDSDAVSDPLGDGLQERMTDLTGDWSDLKVKFEVFRDNLQEAIIRKAIGTRWGGQEAYYEALGQEMKLDPTTLQDYLTRSPRPSFLHRDRPWRQSLSERALLYNHCFVANRNIRKTSEIVGVPLTTVRVVLSRIRIEVSYRYLGSYIPEQLEHEGLEEPQRPEGWDERAATTRHGLGRQTWVVTLGSKKILLFSLVMPIVEEGRPSRAMTSNVRHNLKEATKAINKASSQYDGCGLVIMSTGGDPVLFTRHQIVSLGDPEYVVGDQKMGEVVWKNPELDLERLAEDDSTLKRHPDFRSLLDATVAEVLT